MLQETAAHGVPRQTAFRAQVDGAAAVTPRGGSPQVAAALPAAGGAAQVRIAVRVDVPAPPLAGAAALPWLLAAQLAQLG
eukprot:292985-Chlamydomonas_euryale.AAC.5